MHGFGMAGDLLVLGGYMVGVVCWGYFWYLCINRRNDLFGPMNTLRVLLLIIVIPLVFGLALYLVVIETFERRYEPWWVVLGILAPVLGCRWIGFKLKD